MKTAEMTLAEILGQIPSKTKMAASFEEMSTQELADILRAEGIGKTAAVKKKATMEKLSAIQKIAMADQWGRELAHAHIRMEKIANPAIKGLVDVAKHMATKAAPMVGKATNAVMGASAGRRAAVGAGVGAVGGALKDPGMSSTGQPKSRLGGMLGGAALGAGAGLAAPKLIQGGMAAMGNKAGAPKMLSPGAAPKLIGSGSTGAIPARRAAVG